MQSEYLVAQNVDYAYRKIKVLDGFGFTLKKGEKVSLLGINGSGKSTLFGVLTGLFIHQEGSVHFEGKAISKTGYPISPNFRSRLGVVFQDNALDQKLSANQNLMLAARLYGLSPQEASRRIAALIKALDLEGYENQKVATLSGGLKRRFALLRALVHGPEIVLLDEPTVGLDIASRALFWQKLEMLQKERGMAILVATHQIDEAEKCDRVLVMHEGKALCQKSPAQILENYKKTQIHLTLRQHLSAASGLKIELDHVFANVQVQGDRKLSFTCDTWQRDLPKMFSVVPEGHIENVEIKKANLANAYLDMTGSALSQKMENAHV